MQQGRKCNLRPFGMKAMDSLRLEKSYRVVGRELSVEYSAFESELNRFVHMDKPQFLGRQALAEGSTSRAANSFVTLELEDVGDADARGAEPILYGNELVGRTTSGGYGWRIEKSIALAMVRPDLGAPGTVLDVVILGQTRRATVVAISPYDPDNLRLRA